MLKQVDTPQNLYDFPDNIFVATFIGSPQMNMLRGRYNADAATLTLGSNTISVPEPVRAARPALAGYDGREIAVGIRPEHIADAALGNIDGRSTMSGIVEVREGLGSEVLLHIAVDAGKVTRRGHRIGDPRRRPQQRHRGPSRARSRSCSPTRSPRLAVDTSHLQLFDLESGNAIR